MIDKHQKQFGQSRWNWIRSFLLVSILGACAPASFGALSVSCTAPVGEEGFAYSGTCTAAGGVGPYTYALFTVLSSLPTGLSVTSAGAITGTPGVGTHGNYSFIVQATDTGNANATANSASTGLTIFAAPVVLCTPISTVTPNEVNAPYSTSCAVTGGTAGYTWSLGAGSPNLSLNTTTGATVTLSGTPNAAGTFSYTLTVTDSSTVPLLATKTFSSVVIAGAVSATCTPTGPLEVGGSYSVSCNVTGGVAPFTWSTTGTVPAGLGAINTSTGALSGTLTTAQSASFSIKVADGASTPQSSTAPTSLGGTVIAGPAITCLTNNVPLEVGVSYTNSCLASGGSGGYAWSISAGQLPSNVGQTFTTGSQTLLSGNPTAGGTANYTLRLVDSNGVAVTKVFSGSIAAQPQVSCSPAPPTNPVITNTAFPALTCTVSGGTAPYTLSAIKGTNTGTKILPSGVTLAPTAIPTTATTGIVSGNATDPIGTTYGFTIQVADSATQTDGTAAPQTATSGNYTGTVLSAMTATCSPTGALEVGATYSVTCSVTGGTGAYTWSTTGTVPAGLGAINTSTGAISGTFTTVQNVTFQIKVTDSSTPAQSSTASTILGGNIVAGPSFTCSRTTPPQEATVAYSTTCTATGGSGTYTTWAITAGTLPSYLAQTTPTASTFKLAGTPPSNATGTVDYTVGLTDSAGVAATATHFTGTVNPKVAFTCDNPNAPASTTATYTTNCTVTSGTGVGPFTWSISAGSLPGGVHAPGVLTGNTITYTGVPGAGAAGATSFTIQVADSLAATASLPLSGTITAGPVLTCTNNNAPAEVGVNYATTCSVVSGTGVAPYTFTLTGTPPTYLSTNTSATSIAISGTPTVAGSVSYGVQVADATIPTPLTGSKAFTGTVAATSAFTCGSPKLLADVGSPYSNSCTATAGTGVGPYAWSIIGGSLPAGLSLSSPTTGSSISIAGTPQTAGSATFTLQMQDSLGSASTIVFAGTIQRAPLFTCSNNNVPAEVGYPYSSTCTVLNGTGTSTFSWAITGGSLPAGVTYGTSTNSIVISGTPTGAGGAASYTVQLTDGAGVVASQSFTGTVARVPAFTCTNNNVPAKAGLAYSSVCTITTGTGAGPFAWAISAGALPPGINATVTGTSPAPTTYTLSGTPTGSGAVTYTLLLTDSFGATASQVFTGNIIPPAFTCDNNYNAPQEVGIAYSITCTAATATAPYTWTINGGSLPAGVTRSNPTSTSIKLTGPATSAGAANFTIQLTDSATPPVVTQRPFSSTIAPALAFTCTNGPPTAVGAPYTNVCTVTSGTGVPPYTWAVGTGTSLPPGVTLAATSPATPSLGLTSITLTGPVTASGPINLNLVVSDAASGSATRNFSSTVAASPSLSCSNISTPFEVGIAYSNTCTASGGTAPYAFSIVGTLPAGFTPATTPTTLSFTNATPTAAGPFSYSVQVVDANGGTATQPYAGTIAGVPTITSPSPLPTATLNTPYSLQLSAVGGVPAGYTWTATNLPSWAAMSPSGLITGTPTVTGPTTITLSLYDGYKTSPSVTLVLPVNYYTGQTWTQLSPTGTSPSARAGQASVFDSNTRQLIVFGGSSATGLLNDLWSYSAGGNVWSAISPAGATAPASRTQSAAVYDSVTANLTLFGGQTANNTCSNDTWRLANANSAGGAPAWVAVTPNGSVPAARQGHGSAYDPNSNRMLVFGGDNCNGLQFNDVWVLSNANGTGSTAPSWTQLTPTGTPPSARTFASAVYDPSANRLVLYSGFGVTSVADTEVWTLSNANGVTGTPAWTKTTPTGGPVYARDAHSAVFDPASNRLTVFGGSADSTGGPTNDTWVLANANGTSSSVSQVWTQLATLGTLPAPRYLHTAAYDSTTNQMIVFGGQSGTALYGDVWTLSDANGLVSITGLNPSYFTAGGAAAVNLTISGQGFVPTQGTLLGSQVQWNGAGNGLVTTFVSETQLTATVPGTLLVTPGNPVISVINPGGNTATFTTAILPASGGGGGGGGGGTGPQGDGTALSASPTTLSYSLPAGIVTGSQPVVLTYTSPKPDLPSFVAGSFVQSGSGWLSVVPASGTMTQTGTNGATYSFQATVNVVADPTGINTGSTYAGTVNFRAVNALTSVAVTFNITNPQVTVPTTNISGAVGQLLTNAVAPVGGSGSYSCQVTGGALPAGVSVRLDCSVGGTPTKSGTFTATVTATDGNGIKGQGTLNVNILGITTTALPSVSTGVPYSYSVGAAGGNAPYTFGASGLPLGLSMNSSGNISGTVVAVPAKVPSVVVTVTDATNVTSSSTFNLTVTAPGPLSLATPTLPDAGLGTFYSQSVTATGGIPPYQWQLTGGSLPNGLSLSSSGIISGTPTAIGSSTFTVQVKDSTNATASASATLNVRAAALQLTTKSPLPSGIAGSEYPTQVLTASGGTAPYTFTISQGNLPAGLTLVNGIISGTPTASGDFPVQVGISDSTTPPTTGTGVLSLNVRASGTDLLLNAGNVSFAVASGATTLPAPQVVGVKSTNPTQQIAYTSSVTPVSPWFTVLSSGTTPGILTIGLTSQAPQLAAGPYTASVTLSCGATAACAGKSQTVQVNLTVSAPPPALTVLTGIVALNTTPPAQAQTADLLLQNSGGGQLSIASATCNASWCRAGSVPGPIQGGSTATVTISADPSQLASGFYRTTVDVATSAGAASVPVTFLVSKSSTITLAPSATQMSVPQGALSTNPTGSFKIAAAGDVVSWNASVTAGASWLGVANTAGVSTPQGAGTVTFSINSGSLAPGTYYGTIRIDAAGSTNAPQDFQVVLTVNAATDPVRPDPQPAGLLFLTSVGASAPPAQSVNVFANSTTPVPYSAATDGQAWLAVVTTTTTASATTPGQSSVLVSTAGLTAGVYRATITYATSAAAVKAVNVTLVVAPAGATVSSNATGLTSKATGSCTPTQLIQAPIGLVNNFSATVGRATSIQVRVVNDCGVYVTNARVTASFSNGDPQLNLVPLDNTSGTYVGTWIPRVSGSGVSLDTRAVSDLPVNDTVLSGSVQASAAPLVASGGLINAFGSPFAGAQAPGSIIAAYGANLATQTVINSVFPIPTTLGGTTVLVGGIPAPLYYVSPGQINLQVPVELDPSKRYQVVVNSNGILAAPEALQLAPVTPSIAALSDGTVLAQHSDYSLVSQAAPAKSGEYLVAYLLGLGATDFPVATGAPSPTSPLAHPTVQPTLTIGGTPTPIAFVGLTPGLVGLYQMNFQVPAGLPNGNLPLVVTQGTASTSAVILPVKN